MIRSACGERGPRGGESRDRVTSPAVPRAATTKRTLATALAAVGSVAVTPGIASAVTPLPVLDAARLQGVFVVSGVVTQAVGVPGEHRGEPVTRT